MVPSGATSSGRLWGRTSNSGTQHQSGIQMAARACGAPNHLRQRSRERNRGRGRDRGQDRGRDRGRDRATHSARVGHKSSSSPPSARSPRAYVCGSSVACSPCDPLISLPYETAARVVAAEMFSRDDSPSSALKPPSAAR
eukprot:3631908-Prymnesium_polylepis.1